MEQTGRAVFSLKPKPPYQFTPHLEAFTLPGRPTPILYDSSRRSCRRLLAVGEALVGVEAVFSGEPWRPIIMVEVWAPRRSLADEAQGLVAETLRVDYDYNEFLARLSPWPTLHRLASRYPGLRPGRHHSLYEALIDAVVKQRVALRAGLGVMARLVEAYGAKKVFGGRVFYSAPRPEGLAEADVEELRRHGLTRMKARALREIALARLEERLPSVKEAVEDPESTVEELKRLYGVGEWTARMAVAMVHPRFPTGPLSDLAVQRGLQRLLGEQVARELSRLRRVLGDHLGLLLYLAAKSYEDAKRGTSASSLA